MKKRFLIPFAIFAVLVIVLGIGLTLDPREVPSPLIDKTAPTFELPTLHDPDATFTPEDMKGKVWLLNVWASWCSACRAEHMVLNGLAKTGEVAIVGLNYKDQPQDAINWLEQLGNPYVTSASDINGSAGLDWGVYGVPETFLVDKKGIIRYKQIGPVTEESLSETILPLIRQLKGETS